MGNNAKRETRRANQPTPASKHPNFQKQIFVFLRKKKKKKKKTLNTKLSVLNSHSAKIKNETQFTNVFNNKKKNQSLCFFFLLLFTQKPKKLLRRKKNLEIKNKKKIFIYSPLGGASAPRATNCFFFRIARPALLRPQYESSP